MMVCTLSNEWSDKFIWSEDSDWDLLGEVIGLLVLGVVSSQGKNITFSASPSLISLVDIKLTYSLPKSASLNWSLNSSASPNAASEV